MPIKRQVAANRTCRACADLYHKPQVNKPIKNANIPEARPVGADRLDAHRLIEDCACDDLALR